MMNAEDDKPGDDLFGESPKESKDEEEDGDIWKSAVGESTSDEPKPVDLNDDEVEDYLANQTQNDDGQKLDEPTVSESTEPEPERVADTPPAEKEDAIEEQIEKDIPLDDEVAEQHSIPAKSGETVSAPQPKKIEEPAPEGELNVTVVDPQKRGDGMGSYVVYKVVTSTTLPFFGGRNFEVFRRYSDFLGLYTKLRDKYASYGRIIPPPPEKDMIATTSTKFSKDQSHSNADFVNRRRSALERFMQRLTCSTLYRQDPDLRDFITQTGDLPKSSDTSALSTAGIKRLFSKVSNSVTGVVVPFDDPDPWFDERLEQLSILENQLRKLVDAAEIMQHCRHEAALGVGALGGSLRLLANAEENNALSRAISQLAEATERAQEIRQSQSEYDSLLFSEQVHDYVLWLGAVRGVFEERCKAYRKIKELEQHLNRKREAKARAELQSPAVPDKVRQLEEECSQTSSQLDKAKDDVEKMAQTLKDELSRFEINRAKDFFRFGHSYLERQADTQQQMIDLWTGLLPEIKNVPA